MKIHILVLLSLVIVSATGRAQTNEGNWPATFLSGYERTLHAGGFVYHSPEPEVTSSMLIRSLVSTDYIEWTTQSVPQDFKGDSVYFVWMFGIDVNEDSHRFELYVNGKQMLTFRNPLQAEKKSWTVNGNDGSQLIFIPTMIDKYDDLMGYAVLKLPMSKAERGQGQVIKITGENAASRTWYMTFESPVKEKVNLKQIEAETKENGNRYDLIQVEFVHLGKATSASVTLEDGVAKKFNIETGYNSFLLKIPAVDHAVEIGAKVEMNGRTIEKKVAAKPVRQWTVYLVQHAHTDIGYTRPQNEMLPEHLRYIDYALDYCDLTDKYPDDAKFRWTCETAWAAREYLRTRPPQQVARLLRRIKEGRIEVTGLFLNMSDLYDEPTLANLMQTIREFKQRGIQVKTGMQDDVNGAAWCLVDYLKSAGVKYFSMGQNTDRAMRPFDKPTAFWWESPSGNKVLAYRGEHYMWGDDLGILTGDITGFGNSLFTYLKSLEEKGYQFDRTSIQFSGYYTDNSAPSIKACDLVREWNQKFEWPKLRLATVSEFFDYVNANYSSKLPTYSLAWPDWWIDGFGSAAVETAHIRNAQTDFIANQGLLSMAALLGARIRPDALRDINSINDGIAFYDEHSFGAAESITDPLCENSTVQWDLKSAFAWDAIRRNGLLREEALGLLREFTPRSNTPAITVFNTMNSERSGFSEVFVYNNILPPDKKSRIVDEKGNSIPAQLLSTRAEGSYWAIYARDIPAFGYKTYRIETENLPPRQYAEENFSGIIENDFYRMTIDPDKGAISSLIDKSRKVELVDTHAPWKLGEFIYERLADREEIPRHNVDHYSRTAMKNIRIGKVFDGPIWTSLDITGQINECADSSGITCEIRLYKYEKRVELVYSMKKLQVFEPEGAYVAFPFSSPGGRIAFEVQGGTVVPGKGQLPGSASDWDGVQNFVSIRNNHGQIVLVSPEAPIMEFGDINLGKFQEVSEVDRPYVYSWVLNNYWTTNFRAGQEGGMVWRYDITSTGDTSLEHATRFGWESRIPLVAMASIGANKKGIPASRSFLDLGSGNPLLVYARPAWDGDGIVLCMRETNGEPARLDLSRISKDYSVHSVYEVNTLEEEIAKPADRFDFRPYEVKFIKIRLKAKSDHPKM